MTLNEEASDLKLLDVLVGLQVENDDARMFWNKKHFVVISKRCINDRNFKRTLRFQLLKKIFLIPPGHYGILALNKKTIITLNTT